MTNVQNEYWSKWKVVKMESGQNGKWSKWKVVKMEIGQNEVVNMKSGQN